VFAVPGEVIPRAYDEYDVSDRLKEHGWVLPAYTMAPNAKHIKLLRAVIRYELPSKPATCGCACDIVCAGWAAVSVRIHGTQETVPHSACVLPLMSN